MLLDEFQKTISSTARVHLDVKKKQFGPFRARVALSNFGTVNICKIHCDPVEIDRTREAIKRDEILRYFVLLQLSGSGVTNYNGREITLAPGDFVITDSTRPYTCTYATPVDRLIIQLDQPELDIRARSNKSFCGTRINGSSGIGGLVSGFIQQIAGGIDSLDPPLAAALSAKMLDLLAMVTLPTDRKYYDDQVISSVRYATLQRIQGYIEENLRDPDLRTGKIAQANGVSTRYLQNLFGEVEIQVGSWIRERRLERCYDDLLNPLLRGQNITEIAMGWGFNSPEHFSRVFKERFDKSPRDLRKSAFTDL